MWGSKIVREGATITPLPHRFCFTDQFSIVFMIGNAERGSRDKILESARDREGNRNRNAKK